MANNNVKIINGGGRNLSIDIARAVCIILVVIGHYSPAYSPEWWMDMRSCIYSFHMPLFMFVSGFVYMKFRKNTSYLDFIKKKFKRLIVPYLTVSVIVISIKLAAEHGANLENPVTPLSYLKIFIQPEAGYFLWFIWALWWMFVLIPIFKKRESLYLLFAASIVIHLWLTIPTHLFALNETSRMLVYFMGGVVVADIAMNKPISSELLNGKAMLLGPILFVALYVMNVYGMHVNDMLIAFSGIWMMMSVSNAYVHLSKNSNGILYEIASASYIIYLFHTTFEGFAKSAIRHFPAMVDGENTLMFCVGAILVVGCGVIFPFVLYKYVLRRNRFMRIAFGL